MPSLKSQEYIHEAPFALQVELVEGCNLRCSFCGLNGIRGKDNDYKEMSLDTARAIVKHLEESSWHPRVEFAMHGEPSVHSELLEMLRIFSYSSMNRHLMMTSNGAGFLAHPENIDRALVHLNVLALDWYENVKIVPKILEAYKGTHIPLRYPQQPAANPHRRRKPTEHDWVIIQDISKATKGTHSSLNNHAGAGAPKNESAMGNRCAKPFREMSIRWDGSVAICCNDWRGEYKCGNVNEQSLEEIWLSPAFVAARRKLYHGQRDFGPCAGCDALSYRPGLLPDHKGLASLPEPTAADLRAIGEALAGPSYTLPVLRPWETNERQETPAGSQ